MELLKITNNGNKNTPIAIINKDNTVETDKAVARTPDPTIKTTDQAVVQ